jgi:single-strand DNA-binding protein
MNECNLIGRIGEDPIVRNFGDNGKLLKFSLATNEKIKGNEVTTWHQILVWGKLAESLEPYLVKGKEIFVRGKIVYNVNDKENPDGTKTKFYSTEIHANQIQMFGGGSNTKDGKYNIKLTPKEKNPINEKISSSPSYNNSFESISEENSEDLPF